MKKKLDKKQAKDINFGIDGSFIILCKKRISIYLIIIICTAIYFFLNIIKNSFDNHDLRNYGIEIHAVVTDKHKVGGKGVIRCTYTFEVNKTCYTGSVASDYYMIGDSIEIIYLRKNPKINREKKILMELW